MIVIFLSFFVSFLSAGSNQLKIFHAKQGNFYCFLKISPKEIGALSQQGARCFVQLIPNGKYELEFFRNKTFNNQSALLRYYNSSKDYKGRIKMYPQKAHDYSFKSYYKNLKSLLKRENFLSPDNTIMEFSDDVPFGDCSEKIIKLCCDPRYITIVIKNNSQFLKQTINQELILSMFDQGIAPLVTEHLLEKTKKKDIADVTIKDFLSLIKKCNYADLNCDEKELMKVDDTYLNTKAIFKDKAIELTKQYSQKVKAEKIKSFNTLKRNIGLFCLSFTAIITIFWLTYKINCKFLL